MSRSGAFRRPKIDQYTDRESELKFGGCKGCKGCKVDLDLALILTLTLVLGSSVFKRCNIDLDLTWQSI